MLGTASAILLDCLCVGAGGAIGSICRYLLGLIAPANQPGFPFMTLVINVVGALAIGFLAAFFLRNAHLDPRLLLFLKVGICGGFTTFSTFSLESIQLIQDGNIIAAALYIVASVVLCLVGVIIGQLAANALST